MLIEYEDILVYLLNRKLLSTERIVDSDLAIIDVSRRNYNIKALSEHGPSYFLKQEIRNRSVNDGRFASVAYEAKVYRLIEQIYADKRFCRYLPRYYAFDPDEHLFILEAVTGSISLSDYHLRYGRFPSRITKELGKAAAALHEISESDRSGIERSLGIPKSAPWVFFLTEPDQWIYLNSSAANIEFIKILQASEEICRSFEKLRHQWQADTLIHSDLKWDNCLVHVDTSLRPASRIKIVDWELARIGDSCWDIGTIFSEYLNFWLSSIPVSDGLPPGQAVSLAWFPLEKMRPALRSFWNAYIQYRKIEPEALTNRLQRATGYAGARLVQSAFEELQTETKISNKAICLLQLGANIMARPAEAAVQLLGLQLPMEWYDETSIC